MDPEGFPGALFRAWEPRMTVAHHPVPVVANVAPNPNAAAAAAAVDNAASRGGGGGALDQHHQHHQHQHHQQHPQQQQQQQNNLGPRRAFEFGFTPTRGAAGGAPLSLLPPPPPPRRREPKTLEELFKDYGVRGTTLAKMAEMGFTVQTLVNMTDQELEDVIKTMLEAYHVELLVGEKYGIKAAIRAERKHVEDDLERQKSSSSKAHQQQHHPARASDKRRRLEDHHAAASKEGSGRRDNVSNNNSTTSANFLISDGTGAALVLRDPLLLAQQQQQQEQHPQELVAGAGTSIISAGDTGGGSDSERKRHGKKKQKRKRPKDDGEDGEEDRPREHPFIVTEPGELARGKKNGLDYLFDLYEQCGKYLDEVQQQCKERGEKCPTKVTNQVFRHAKHRGASYINKPKMRHYVHCYALHCLDLEHSNRLRKMFKDRGENVGAWRQACYYPLVEMARNFNWDIEGVFSRNDKLRIWYVPTRLRQLCHLEKSKEE